MRTPMVQPNSGLVAKVACTIEIIIHYIIYQDMQMKYDSILIRLEFLKISSIFWYIRGTLLFDNTV